MSDAELRRKDDRVMAEMQRDIKELKKSAKTTQENVVALTTTITEYNIENKESHDKFDRAIFGDRDKEGNLLTDGLWQKVARHEKVYKIWEFLLYDWKGIVAFIGFIGYPVFRDIITEVLRVLAK